MSLFRRRPKRISGQARPGLNRVAAVSGAVFGSSHSRVGEHRRSLCSPSEKRPSSPPQMQAPHHMDSYSADRMPSQEDSQGCHALATFFMAFMTVVGKETSPKLDNTAFAFDAFAASPSVANTKPHVRSAMVALPTVMESLILPNCCL